MTPWTVARQASLSFTISQSLIKLMSIESVMPSNHLILCCPFSLCLQSFLASGSFPVSCCFTPGGQSIGNSVVKNPPAKAGDVSLIPHPGRPHMLQSNYACTPHPLRLCSGAGELHPLSPPAAILKLVCPEDCTPQ